MSIITTTYRRKQLPMLQINSNQIDLWNKHPVKISGAEEKTFNLGRAISILANEVRAPSQMAGIQSEQITSSLVRRIDRAYDSAMKAYKEKLEKAEAKDRKSIKVNKNFWIYENYPGFAWAIKILGASFISRAQYEHDARACRFTWLIEVSFSEEQRLTAVKHQIEDELSPLIDDLKYLEEHNQTDVDLLRQVKHLKDIYRAHFPNESLDQEEYLERLAPLEARFLT